MNGDSMMLLAQRNDGGGTVFMLVWLAIVVLAIIGLWKVFAKAGKPGWGCLIPIYNIILLLDIAGRPIWWIILFFIPLVNIIVCIIVPIDVARNFGKGTGFGLGLAFLGFIFYPILGFSDAQYSPVPR
jgi:hypothetical protein